MKLTKSQIKQLIKEELRNVLKEQWTPEPGGKPYGQAPYTTNSLDNLCAALKLVPTRSGRAVWNLNPFIISEEPSIYDSVEFDIQITVKNPKAKPGAGSRE